MHCNSSEYREQMIKMVHYFPMWNLRTRHGTVGSVRESRGELSTNSETPSSCFVDPNGDVPSSHCWVEIKKLVANNAFHCHDSHADKSVTSPCLRYHATTGLGDWWRHRHDGSRNTHLQRVPINACAINKHIFIANCLNGNDFIIGAKPSCSWSKSMFRQTRLSKSRNVEIAKIPT